jgi:hypothetical protein
MRKLQIGVLGYMVDINNSKVSLAAAFLDTLWLSLFKQNIVVLLLHLHLTK